MSLILFLIVVTAYNGWEDMFSESSEKEKTVDDLDFMMYGPVRKELGNFQNKLVFFYLALYCLCFGYILSYLQPLSVNYVNPLGTHSVTYPDS